MRNKTIHSGCLYQSKLFDSNYTYSFNDLFLRLQERGKKTFMPVGLSNCYKLCTQLTTINHFAIKIGFLDN